MATVICCYGTPGKYSIKKTRAFEKGFLVPFMSFTWMKHADLEMVSRNRKKEEVYHVSPKKGNAWEVAVVPRTAPPHIMVVYCISINLMVQFSNDPCKSAYSESFLYLLLFSHTSFFFNFFSLLFLNHGLYSLEEEFPSR